MEKIDFLKWWSESSLAVRYNALLSVGILGLITIIIYQHNERKSDAELHRMDVVKFENTISANNRRFDSVTYSLRMEIKDCESQRYEESIKNAEMFRTLYKEKQTLKVTYNNGY